MMASFRRTASRLIAERAVSLSRALLAASLGSAAAVALYPVSAYAAFFAGVAVMSAFILWPRRPPLATARESPPHAAMPFLEGGARAVLEAIPEPALLVDQDLHLRLGNEAATRAFGELGLGEPIALRFRSPDFLAAVEAAVESALPGKAVIPESGSLGRTWAVDIAPVAHSAGMPPGLFLLLFRDRTAERRIERMRTDFVANASHELRTPLASLIGFIETLQGPARDDRAARDRFLAIMREQAARMSRLIDDLLSLSQIEMKRHPVSGRTVDLAELLHDVRRQMAPLIEDSGMAVELDIAPVAPIVDGERDELQQVFSNLVENACKYGAGGGRLVLSVGPEGGVEGGGIRASVRDFGPGIAAEHVPRLTERFYRVDVESSRAKRGTGLGLSIVRNILLRHAARLVIESEPGKGSTFAVVFPARKGTRKNMVHVNQQDRMS